MMSLKYYITGYKHLGVEITFDVVVVTNTRDNCNLRMEIIVALQGSIGRSLVQMGWWYSLSDDYKETWMNRSSLSVQV